MTLSVLLITNAVAQDTTEWNLPDIPGQVQTDDPYWDLELLYHQHRYEEGLEAVEQRIAARTGVARIERVGARAAPQRGRARVVTGQEQRAAGGGGRRRARVPGRERARRWKRRLPAFGGG